ncbi:hypothetical protein KM043_014465 [Ampulex compressa]|nr:hypothetical protein KM043_014465 [Ampulex compressa]
MPCDYCAVATPNQTDEKLKTTLATPRALQLKKVLFLETDVDVYRAISTGHARRFVIKEFRRAMFQRSHGLAHPVAKVLTILVTQWYVWPSIKSTMGQR